MKLLLNAEDGKLTGSGWAVNHEHTLKIDAENKLHHRDEHKIYVN